MWWLFAIDGPSLIGDAIFTIGAIVLGGSILDSLFSSTTSAASPSASIDPKEHEKALSQAQSYAIIDEIIDRIEVGHITQNSKLGNVIHIKWKLK